MGDFEFDIELTARTTDEGGLRGSFERQLNELGGVASLTDQVGPYRVDSSDGVFWFEQRRTYHIVM